jgi:hypothetical protein
MPVSRIDRDDVWLKNVGIAMSEVGFWVVDIVAHPSEGRRPIQLDVQLLERFHAAQNL